MKAYLLCVLILAAFQLESNAQDSKLHPYSGAYDIQTDARNIALGETGIANPVHVRAYSANPANLVGMQKLHFYYQTRDVNWYNSSQNDINLFSAGALYKNRLGCWGFNYTRYSFGEYERTSVTEPDGTGARVKQYNHALALSWAKKIMPNVSAGVNVKMYGVVYNVVKGDIPAISTKPAFYADLGALYSADGFFDQPHLADKIFVGLALQNVGTAFQYKSEDMNSFIKYDLPIYLGIGFTYDILATSANDKKLFETLFTVEYRRYMNPPDYQKKEASFGGLGMETILFDLFSLRLGGVYLPYSNIYGTKSQLAMRYGFGLDLPVKRLGIDMPINVSLDLAHIPINDISYFSKDKNNLLVANFNLVFDNFKN